MDSPPHGTRLLLVEEDPQARSASVEFLGRSGFLALGAGTGTEALALALAAVPDIVVTDMLVPGLDGFGLAAALRAHRRTRHVPVIGMTTQWTSDLRKGPHGAWLGAMLLKPCVPAHLLGEIERVLRHARLTHAALGGLTVGAEPAMPVGLRNAVRRRHAY